MHGSRRFRVRDRLQTPYILKVYYSTSKDSFYKEPVVEMWELEGIAIVEEEARIMFGNRAIDQIKEKVRDLCVNCKETG